MTSKTFPEGDESVSINGHDPGVCSTFGFGANTDVCIEAKAEQQRTEQYSMILTVLSQNISQIIKVNTMQFERDFIKSLNNYAK